MDFFSLEFIIFLFSTFVLFYLSNLINRLTKKTIINQWLILLVASLIFYGFTNYVYLIYLAISFSVSYSAGLLCQYKLFKNVTTPDSVESTYELNPYYIDSSRDRRKYEVFVTTIAILINVGILVVLKYFNFFCETINSLFNFGLTTYNFIIPLGISFYTFSLIAYNVDCYKRETKAEKNPLKFLLYVSYFPKILQGPISSFQKLKDDGLFNEHRFSEINYLKYFFRISIGLIKKIAIANVLNLYVNASYSNLNSSFGCSLILTSILYSTQLYCDFSGFADITIGVSGLFGIKMEENFDIPYISSSIQEFWRRWHITLGAWLKKYIYIPLGGNRVPIWKWAINILIVWFVSGIWHGANWTFIVWGLLHGLLLVLTGIPKQLKKEKNVVQSTKKAGLLRVLSVTGTFAFVNLTWIFFRSQTIKESGQFILHLVQIWKTGQYSVFNDQNLVKTNFLLIIASILVIILILIKVISCRTPAFLARLSEKKYTKYIVTFATTVLFISIATFVHLYLTSIGGGESAFIYFDF